MAVYPTFQVKLFDSGRGIHDMEEAANNWLISAGSEVMVVDRQIALTARTAEGMGSAEITEPYAVLAIWYTRGVLDDTKGRPLPRVDAG
jgi:hypothetical protein